MSVILILGANGLCGQELQHALLFAGHRVIATDINEIDITDENVLDSAFDSVDFDAVINAASVSDIEECQRDYDRAYAVNAIGAKSVAKACSRKNVPLVHLSSGYVYASNTEDKISEKGKTRAECAYAKTRLFGERFVLESSDRALVIRTTWLFSSRAPCFIRNILEKAKSNQSIDVYADEYSCPTPAKALSEDIVKILPSLIDGSFDRYGIYNYSSKECVSRAELARVALEYARHLKLLENEVAVNAVRHDSYKDERLRPECVYPDTARFERIFSIAMPKCADYIEETLRGSHND